MNETVKRLRRQTIEILIRDCEKIIENAPIKTTLLTLTLQERNVFNALINEMVASLSTIEKTQSPKSFIRDYTSLKYEIAYRMFLRTEVTTCRRILLIKFIEECKQIADTEICTLDELKDNQYSMK